MVHIGPGGATGRGGMGMIVHYLSQAFAERSDAPHCQVLDSYGPGRFILMPFFFMRCCWQLVWGMWRGEIDLVHIHMASYGSVLRKGILVWLGRLLGKPVVLHLHGADFVEFVEGLSPRQRRWLIQTMDQAARIVVIGCYWQEYVTKQLHLDPAKVALVPNGVPAPPMTKLSFRSICHLLTLGELGPRKGTPEILLALNNSLVRNLEWNATLAGNGLVAETSHQVAQLGLTHRIQVPGWVDQAKARALLASSDIFLLPSRLEGLPMAILEAMAVGVVVIATPVGAIPDAIEDGVTGLLVSPGDASALAFAIARLVADRALRQQLAEKARQRFLEQFTIQRTASLLLELYGQIETEIATTCEPIARP